MPEIIIKIPIIGAYEELYDHESNDQLVPIIDDLPAHLTKHINLDTTNPIISDRDLEKIYANHEKALDQFRHLRDTIAPEEPIFIFEM